MSFAHYEEDFNELRTIIDGRIASLADLPFGGERRAEIQKAEDELRDAEQTLRDMEMNMRSFATNTSMQNKLKGYENEITRMKNALKKSTVSLSKADRDELLGGKNDVSLTSLDQRERLLKTTQKLQSTSSILEDAIRTADDTVGHGIKTMEELDIQSGKIRKMKDKTGDINDELGRGRRIMRSMSRRAVQTKVIIAVIILVLLVAIGFIVYYKWIRKK